MTTVGLTPRSALRYRPMTSETQCDPAVGPVRASRQTIRPRITRKLRKTTRKLSKNGSVNQQEKDAANTCTARQAQNKQTTTEQPTAAARSETLMPAQHHTTRPMIVTTVALAMIATFVLIVLGQLALSWVNVTLDDLHYGRPRTFQMDAYVGQEQGSSQPSHFVAMNNKGQIEIIEMPGNDPARTRVFMGPQLVGPQADLVPVTLQFVDPQHTHHPDMLVQFEQITLVFQNSQGTFHQKS